MKTTNLHIAKDMFGGGFRVWVVQKRPGEMAIGDPVVMRTLTREEEHSVCIPETFQLGAAGAQELVDQLWAAGVRPTAAAGSVGQLAAMESHLKDLRRLVFDKESYAGVPVDEEKR